VRCPPATQLDKGGAAAEQSLEIQGYSAGQPALREQPLLHSPRGRSQPHYSLLTDDSWDFSPCLSTDCILRQSERFLGILMRMMVILYFPYLLAKMRIEQGVIFIPEGDDFPKKLRYIVAGAKFGFTTVHFFSAKW
jgi:hypothetical protein